jgi:hypothetical protein
MNSEPVTTFLNECRRYYPMPPSELLGKVSFCTATDQDGLPYDTNQEFRGQVCDALNRDLQDSDREFVRYLLEQEILEHKSSWGVNENIKLCAYLLFRLGHVEDSLIIWRAKSTNFDTACGVDVQLLAGAGLECTIQYLKEESSDEATEAVSYLEQCIESGDFRNLERQRAFYRKYFGPGDE